MTVFDDFAALYDFPLDDFQRRACESLVAGHGVLVAAPTGSGKTLVGEFAVHLALANGGKCFYTTPIKALSNQKFADLTRRYGVERVGLLTGDNAINGDAPIVVMTTEVLRNMLYARSATLLGLRFVVMDEVHYLADRSRGAVWEEVIIHLPESVSIVSLSATVSNAEEFGDWLRTVRGQGDIIVEERRPVPLFQHVMVGQRMYDLFANGGRGNPDDEVNPELTRVARDDWQRTRTRDHRSKRGGYRRPAGRALVPSRVDVVDRLESEGLLPAIMFIFSRAGCDAAVQQALNANLRLTSPTERQQIRDHAESRVLTLPVADLAVLGHPQWLEALGRGIAAHHAGMLPVFKECVEDLFSRGLVKMVFATETLALGINMPARSVVIDRLSKWNGETHADVTPGEYTQLTGRAGRRGIDVEGHAVVLWTPGFDPRAVAGLASTRTYPLRSSFRPSYNMAVNLVEQVGKTTARELLESSFAQFQADRAVVGLAREVRRAEEGLAGYAESITCGKGDFMAYASLKRRLTDVEKSAQRKERGDRSAAVAASLDRLKVGDVIAVPTGRWAGLALVLDLGVRSVRDGPRPLVLTLDRQARRLSMVDFSVPVAPVTRMRVPKTFNPRNAGQRRELAMVLRDRTRDLPGVPNDRVPGRGPSTEQPEISRLRAQIRSHPCHSCPDREHHARWAERYLKLERETNTLRRRIEQRTNTIAREFDRVCEVLQELGYLDGDTVTPAGHSLSRLYSELDLLAAECLRRGTWAGLEAPALAAVLSALVFESRKPDDVPRPRVPGGAVRSTLEAMTHLWAELDAVEKSHGVNFLREPDLGFAWAAYRWAGGADLDDVLDDVDLAAGDFVRWVKQVLDVADQVGAATTDPALRSTVRELVTSMRRGVVAYSADLD
jgi:ATP-dependent RNA helicase HelY